jgi:HEAT repeat protein
MNATAPGGFSLTWRFQRAKRTPTHFRLLLRVLLLVAAPLFAGCAKANPRPSIPTLIQRLQDEDPKVRVTAAETLATCCRLTEEPEKDPEVHSAVLALTRALNDEIPEVSNAAALALAVLAAGDGRFIGLLVTTALPALHKIAADREHPARRCAIMALGNIGPRAGAALPDILAAAADQNADVRAVAVEALRGIDPWSGRVRRVFLAALRDKEQMVRAEAAYAFRGTARPDDKEVIEALIHTLKDEQKYIAGAAAEALGKIGPDASAAIPALRNALTDRDPDLRAKASEALQKIMAE